MNPLSHLQHLQRIKSCDDYRRIFSNPCTSDVETVVLPRFLVTHALSYEIVNNQSLVIDNNGWLGILISDTKNGVI